MDKISELLEFLKYLVKKIFVEPIRLMYELIRTLLYPKAWFYAIFTVFVLRIFLIRETSDMWDRILMVTLIILILWKEYTSWYTEWKGKQRKEIRDKVIKEHMKGK